MTYTKPARYYNTDYYKNIEFTNSIEARDAGIAEHIKKTGWSVQMIPYEDEDGNPVMRENGEPMPEFAYSVGNCLVGKPEVMGFYPSASSLYSAVNRVTKFIREGLIPVPEQDEFFCVGGVIPGVDVSIYILDQDQQVFADEKYSCQKLDGVPVVMVGIPKPDGNFLPVCPNQLMPSTPPNAMRLKVIDLDKEDN